MRKNITLSLTYQPLSTKKTHRTSKTKKKTCEMNFSANDISRNRPSFVIRAATHRAITAITDVGLKRTERPEGPLFVVKATFVDENTSFPEKKNWKCSIMPDPADLWRQLTQPIGEFTDTFFDKLLSWEELSDQHRAARSAGARNSPVNKLH